VRIVNRLLTISIKVNVPSAALRSGADSKGFDMLQAIAKWLWGGGTGNTGVSG
jgi:hypothetical protein